MTECVSLDRALPDAYQAMLALGDIGHATAGRYQSKQNAVGV